MTILRSEQFCLFPESNNQFGAATHALKSPNGVETEFSKSLGTKIGKLMLLPVPPQILHRIELWGIGRQVLKLNPAGLLSHKVFDQPAAMRPKPIPDHQQVLGDVAHQMGEKLNDLWTSDTARV